MKKMEGEGGKMRIEAEKNIEKSVKIGKKIGMKLEESDDKGKEIRGM